MKGKFVIIPVLIFLVLVILIPLGASEGNEMSEISIEHPDLAPMDDDARSSYIKELKGNGYSNAEIADIIAQVIHDEYPDIINANFAKNPITPVTEEKIRSEPSLYIDPRIELASPYWEYLAAREEDRNGILDMINKSDASETEKKEFINFLQKFWGKYPIKFEKLESQTRITLEMEDQLKVPNDENIMLSKIDHTIHNYQKKILDESVTEQTDKEPPDSPKWGAEPHRSFIYWACKNMWVPDSVWGAGDVAQWANDSSTVPDQWSYLPPGTPAGLIPYLEQVVFSYNMYYNPYYDSEAGSICGLGWLFHGGAPDNAQEYATIAKYEYESGNYYNAFTNLGYSSHFTADVGNPFHTGKELSQWGHWISVGIYPTCFIYFWDTDHKTVVHDAYENYTSDNWTWFESYVSNNKEWAPASMVVSDGVWFTTQNTAVNSHQDVNELYTLVHNNAPDVWRNPNTAQGLRVKQITEHNIYETSKNINKIVLMDFLLRMLPGEYYYPMDIDMDKKFEDVDGSGTLTEDDIICYFQNMDYIEDYEPRTLFDYDSDDRITYVDLIALYNEYLNQ